MLLQGDLTLFESLITCDYVDEVFPGRQLRATEPAARARERMLVEQFNQVVLPQMKIWFGWKRGQGATERPAASSEGPHKAADQH